MVLGSGPVSLRHPIAGRDLLRKERFGALYYHRASAQYHAIPPAQAQLLVEATELSALEAYRRSFDGFGLGEDQLLGQVVAWQGMGLLDRDHRCSALVIDGDRKHGALSGPLVTNIQVTRACNLSCEHCFVDVTAKADPRELSTGGVHALFRELADLAAPIVILAGGEPLTRDDLFEILAPVEDLGLDVALCTNATLITAKNAPRLVASPIRWYSISLDGPDEATHDAIRGKGAFARAVRGVERLMDAGAQDVKLRVTVTAHNAQRLAEISRVATALNVDKVVMKPFRHTAGFFGHDANVLYIGRDEYLAAVQACDSAWPSDAPPLELDDGMPYGLPAWTKVVPRFGCVGGTTHASITYDGKVVACDAVQDPDDWTLHTRTFAEAWRGAPTLVSWRHLGGNEGCGACERGGECRGGCRARAIGLGGTIDDPDPWAYCTSGQSIDDWRQALGVRGVGRRRLTVI